VADVLYILGRLAGIKFSVVKIHAFNTVARKTYLLVAEMGNKLRRYNIKIQVHRKALFAG